MRKTLAKLAGAAALAAAIADAGARARRMRLDDVVRGKQAGDFVVGLGAIGVLPSNGGTRRSHRRQAGGEQQRAAPQLDFTYFITPNIALNLIAATTRHDVSVKGSALGDRRSRPCLGAAADADPAVSTPSRARASAPMSAPA